MMRWSNGLVGMAFREFVYDLKSMFKGWNLLAWLWIGFIAFYFGINERRGGFEYGIYALCGPLWVIKYLKPKMNKLQYVLPIREESRISYILAKSIIVFIFILCVVGFGHVVGIILGGVSLFDSVQKIALYTIPLLITHLSYMIHSIFKVNELKRNKLWGLISLLLAVLPIIKGTEFAKWLGGGSWYTVMIVATYVGALQSLCYQVYLLKKNDTSFDNINTEGIF